MISRWKRPLGRLLCGVVMACCVTLSAAAQEVVVNIPELADNKDYIELLRHDLRLQMRADSLLGVMGGLRGEMREKAEMRDTTLLRSIDSLSRVLSGVEGEMMALRHDKLKLMNRINAIEQESVLSSMNNTEVLHSQGTGSIFNNDYFKASLFEEDYEVLMSVNKSEVAAYDCAVKYAANYRAIKDLYDSYLKASTESEAEDIYAKIAEMADENFVVERRLAKLWTDIFDQKTYVYSYFLEKEGRDDILELTENLTLEARQQQMMISESCASESVAGYCLQKPVVLNYELCVAKLLNLSSAIDSLSLAARNIRQIDYRMPALDVERRSFVDYAPIEFRARTPYNSSNPIPECVNYEYGTIYRILLGTYKYQQSPSIFRGAVPLCVEVEPDGRFSYYAGGLRTLSEAEAAVAAMQKKGFRNPRIIEWCDGRKTNLSEQGAVGTVAYRLIISGGALDEMVQEVIADMASGCQVSRLGDGKFVVGMFDSEAVAQRVANAVMKCDEKLSVEVAALRTEEE